MKLEKVKLEKLKPLENNVRRHNEKQIAELEKSVKQFGQTRAIVIDEENNILIGNGLYFALTNMGVEEAECYRKTGLNEIQKKKLILSDNKTYSLGSDDYAEINNYIKAITDIGDFDIAGFDADVLEQMVATDEEVEAIIENYGNVTEENLIKKEDLIQPQPQEDNEVKQATIITETKTGKQDDKKQYIVCPNCGEVIYLD